MSATTAKALDLLGRIRPLLPDEPIREVRMFGAVAVMVDEAMVVAVHNDGSLLVRVHPDDDAELLTRPSAARAEMGAGRSMGTGWVHVGAAGVATDDTLGAWVEYALRYWRRQPGRRAASRGRTSRTPTG